ncbi:HAD family hydrolase [Flindersiella endophytica]
MTAAAIVFDLDGTLVDTMSWVPGTYVDTIRALGGPTVTPGEVLASFSIGPTAAVLELFLARPIAEVDLQVYHDHYTAAAATTRPFPGVVEMLETLHSEGIELAIFTGAQQRAATHLLAATGLDRWFGTVIGGDDAGQAKPAPDGLRLACERLDVEPADAAYVGDTLADLRCAVSAGSLPIHAAWSGTTVPATDEHAVARTPSDLLHVVRARLGGAAAQRPVRRTPRGTPA